MTESETILKMISDLSDTIAALIRRIEALEKRTQLLSVNVLS